MTSPYLEQAKELLKALLYYHVRDTDVYYVECDVKKLAQALQSAVEAETERCVRVIENLRIVAILDQHDVSDEDAQYAGEIHNQSIDKAVEAILQRSKEEV